MPSAKTKNAGRAAAGERKRNGSPAPAPEPKRNGVPLAAPGADPDHDIPGLPVVRGRMTLADGTPCVILSEADYDRVFHVFEERDLMTVLEDPKTEWIDLEDYKAQLAASKLAAARKTRGLTQVQLARRLRLPQSQISRIERNPDHTTVRTLKRIAAALHVNVADLLR